MYIASCHWLLLNLLISTLCCASSLKVPSVSSSSFSSVVSSSALQAKVSLTEVAMDESKSFRSHESLLRVKRKGSRLSSTGRKGPRDRLDYRKNTSFTVSSRTRVTIFIQLCTISLAHKILRTIN